MVLLAIFDDLRKQLEEHTNRGQNYRVIIGIENLRCNYIKKQNDRTHRYLQLQERQLSNNNEKLEMMCQADNSLVDLVNDMNGAYGQTFQLDLIKHLWNTKSVSDEKFLANRDHEIKIFGEYLESIPLVKQVKELEQQSEQNKIKLAESEKKLAKKEKISKKLEAKLNFRQKISTSFIVTREKILAELQESNRNIEDILNGSTKSSRSSIDSPDNEHEKVQVQEVESIPIVATAPVEPSNVVKSEPRPLKKLVCPNFNLEAMDFKMNAKSASFNIRVKPHESLSNNMTTPKRSPNICIPNERVRFDKIRIMAPIRTVPVSLEDFKWQSQIQSSKRKNTDADGFMDGSKSTKQPRTSHSKEMSDDNDDRRKSLPGGNKENVIQHGERPQKMHSAGSSSSQEDRNSLIAPIQRLPSENVGNVHDSRSSAKIDKLHEALQYSSAADSSSQRPNMDQPDGQRSSAFVAYSGKQKSRSSNSSSLSSENHLKVPQKDGHVNNHRQKTMAGDGRKSSMRRDDEHSTMHSNLAERGESGSTSTENRSTMPKQTDRKSDPIMLRQNQHTNKTYGRKQSMPVDGRRSSTKRDHEATMPYPGLKLEKRKSVSPAKQQNVHGSAGATMYDKNRQKQQSDYRRGMTHASTSRDEKMVGQRSSNKPKEHGLDRNASPKPQTERKSTGDEMYDTSKRRNHPLVDNYGMGNRQYGRKSNPNVGSFPEQRNVKSNSGDGDEMQRYHENTSKVSSSANGPNQPLFLVPTTKPSDIKPKLENKQMVQSNSGERNSPAPSAVSNTFSQSTYVHSGGTDFDNLLDFDDCDDIDSMFALKSTFSNPTSEFNYLEQMRPISNDGDLSPDGYEWDNFVKTDKLKSPMSDAPEFEMEDGDHDEVPEGFEGH